MHLKPKFNSKGYVDTDNIMVFTGGRGGGWGREKDKEGPTCKYGNGRRLDTG